MTNQSRLARYHTWPNEILSFKITVVTSYSPMWWAIVAIGTCPVHYIYVLRMSQKISCERMTFFLASGFTITCFQSIHCDITKVRYNKPLGMWLVVIILTLAKTTSDSGSDDRPINSFTQTVVEKKKWLPCESLSWAKCASSSMLACWR